MQGELTDIKGHVQELENVYSKEKKGIRKLQEIRKNIEETNQKILRAEREYDLDTAAKLRHGIFPDLEAKLSEAESSSEQTSSRQLLREDVTEDEVAQIVSRWTGIPIKD